MTRPDHVASTGLGRLFRGQTAVDFYGLRRVGLIVAIVVLVVTAGSLWTRGLNLGLDFEGGVAWDVPAGAEFDVTQAEEVLAADGVSVSAAKIQRRSSADGTTFITVQVEELPQEQIDALSADFAARAGVPTDDVNFSFTSSTWGGEITRAAVRALVIFLALVALFISIRFEWRMAIAALAAMAHDVIATVGFYSVFQFEVTPATVIAFLTILGYSLYDTIVVFDRVQENEGKYAGVRMPYQDIVNISMNQVLMRSINTSMSSILPVISLLFVGAGLLGAVALSEFGLALLVGMISGVYSSIFVATPVLATLRSSTGRKSRRERLRGEDLRAAVIGAGVTGRVMAPADTGAADDEHDDEAKTAALVRPADRLLTHPPRPRKKKKR